jgi:glycosyltransferase involved in cell wall biosynthesis
MSPRAERHDPESRPVRVVDIINLSSSADTLLRERVLMMRASGLDNRIVCMDGPRVAALRALGIPVHVVHLPRGLQPWKLVAALFETTAYLRRSQADIVHTHCSVPGLVGRLAAWLAGVPVIIHTVHGFHFHEGTSWLARLPYLTAERLCGLVTDTLLTQNRSDLEQAERLGIGPRGRRRQIGNGIDLAQFHPRPGRSRPNQTPILTCVARLEPVKNHRMLLEGAGILNRRGLRFRLRLVGDGPLRPEYQELCRRLGISAQVEFLGYRNDIPELLAETDIAVLTSIKEGLPRAVLEAMAMGLPVVATRVPGTREVVRHGETGFIVEVEDTEGLADALGRLIEDPALRVRLGEQGHRMALEEFDEHRVVDALRELYRSRLRARGMAARAGTLPEAVHDGILEARVRAKR